MASGDTKTQPTKADPRAFLEAVDNDRRRHDAFEVLEMMERITGYPPKMWGPSLIGFDQYHYKYESGREGDFFITGLSPRKANLALYIMPGFDHADELMAKLGKHKTGKSCLYINKLDDIDRQALEQLVARSVTWMREKYHG